MGTRSERQLVHEARINAPVERVWALISDVRNAPQWSSQARKVFAIGAGTKKGTFSVNLNHRGKVAWPTWAKVVDFQPNTRFANEVGMAGAVWVFELERGEGEHEGTSVLRQYRETFYPRGLIAGRLVTPAMGGEEKYNAFMDARVDESVEKIKAIAENGQFRIIEDMANNPGKKVRSFESEVEIDAPIATVWELVGEVENAPKWAPTTKKVRAFGGRTKNGTLSLNLNKQGPVYWPTTGKVVDYVPGKRISNMATSGSEWVFELSEGAGGPGTTTLKQYRDAPAPVVKLFANVLSKATGGEDKFSEGLGKGVNTSLRRIKSLAEGK